MLCFGGPPRTALLSCPLRKLGSVGHLHNYWLHTASAVTHGSKMHAATGLGTSPQGLCCPICTHSTRLHLLAGTPKGQKPQMRGLCLKLFMFSYKIFKSRWQNLDPQAKSELWGEGSAALGFPAFGSDGAPCQGARTESAEPVCSLSHRCVWQQVKRSPHESGLNYKDVRCHA